MDKKINHYYFTILNKNTKRAKHYINAFNGSSNYSLNDCYGTYSNKKSKAFKQCLEIKSDLDGKNGKIATHNLNEFTYGFMVNNDLYIITRCNNFVISL